METKKVVEIAVLAAEILLSNGAEAYRVEDTISKICSSYGLTGECISNLTGIFISITGPDGEMVTSIKRIRQRRVDLYRVELINSFSRSLMEKPVSYEEAKRILRDITDAPSFNLGIRLMAASMTSFVYTLFFKGTIPDAIVALIISLGIYFILQKIDEVGFFQFLQYFLSGLLIGALSISIQHLLPIIQKDNVITGAIIVLLPGVSLTNGIKDILYGDYVSGLAQFGEAVLIIIAMSAGIVSALSLFMKWM
ncbi:threonine/serine exporter family protein [Ruminiclostridium josui]|uniref:threonine/serine exporter family protein n=1 Tax=Ruminiclostridium josui TaxID=1499 RepID=UPI000465C12A|nr:threonine/serine exporter family protein [Ruminiclostridium josui]